MSSKPRDLGILLIGKQEGYEGLGKDNDPVKRLVLEWHRIDVHDLKVMFWDISQKVLSLSLRDSIMSWVGDGVWERVIWNSGQHERMFCFADPSTAEAVAVLFVVWDINPGEPRVGTWVHFGPQAHAMTSIPRLATPHW